MSESDRITVQVMRKPRRFEGVQAMNTPKLTEPQRALLADLASKGGHIVSWGSLRRSLRRDMLIDANGYITDAGRAALKESK